MITKQERTAFKKTLGNNYTGSVIAVLEINNVLDTENKTHSASMIRQVFNGLRNHEEIEMAIIKAVEIEQKKKIALLKKKKKLILKSA
jgi:hypothetical protein